jgi:hypothetical protein
MQALYGRPVFAVESRTFYWEDVVLDAIHHGSWAEVEQSVREGLAAADNAAEGEDLEAAVEEAAQEFRYERDLVTAKEMESWLEARDISAGEWMDFIRRQVLRRQAGERLAEMVEEYAPDPEQEQAALRVELICSGAGEELAYALAERAAAAAAAGGDTDEPAEPEMPDSLPVGLAPERARERSAILAAIGAAAERFKAAAVTAELVQREISHHHTEWIRIDSRRIGFSSDAEAREAALCVREDGLSLDEVAASSHAEIQESSFYLDDLDAELRTPFLGARANDLLGPVSFEGEHTLFQIEEKVMPSEEDPDVRGKAEDAVLRRVLEEQARRRMRWQLAW